MLESLINRVREHLSHSLYMAGEEGGMDGWMNGVLGHFYALSRLNWAGDNLG